MPIKEVEFQPMDKPTLHPPSGSRSRRHLPYPAQRSFIEAFNISPEAQRDPQFDELLSQTNVYGSLILRMKRTELIVPSDFGDDLGFCSFEFLVDLAPVLVFWPVDLQEFVLSTVPSSYFAANVQ